eukprot:6192954-Pleurochrysis_carterae.AAC.2
MRGVLAVPESADDGTIVHWSACDGQAGTALTSCASFTDGAGTSSACSYNLAGVLSTKQKDCSTSWKNLHSCSRLGVSVLQESINLCILFTLTHRSNALHNDSIATLQPQVISSHLSHKRCVHNFLSHCVALARYTCTDAHNDTQESLLASASQPSNHPQTSFVSNTPIAAQCLPLPPNALLLSHPVFAHWSAAAAATLFGCVLAAGRGAVFAATCAPAERAAGFAFATRGAAPLYVVPFVLGSQLDCYETQWELARRGTRRTDLSHSAVDLG